MDDKELLERLEGIDDFSDDGASKEYKEITDPVEKFIIYQASDYSKGELWGKSNKKKDDYKMCDPDSNSKLLREIYRKLWDEEKYLKLCKEGDTIFGETMNSVNTTLGQLYKSKEFHQSHYGIYTITKHYFYEKGWLPSCKEADEFKSGLIEVLETDDNHFKTFVECYHTLGNFIPFPVGCNSPRGTGSLKDYWDLTMKWIHNYYQSHDIDKIYVIVGLESANNFKKWLDEFGNWESFIEENYLQPFVDEKNYYPKELWKDHFGRCDVLPRNAEECVEYFKNATAMIKERSELMLNVLDKKLGK